MSKRVAIYARVSTTRQAENDISIPDQLAQARKFCEGRGWYVVREFVDPGASARDDKRPEFQAVMDMACVDPSPFDVIVVHSQSRFFRDTAGYVVSKRRLQKYGVSLISMTQDFGEGPSADFAETIIAAADALSSAETAKHVSRTMLENARQGYWNGSKPPFGYRTIAAEQRGQRIKKRLEVEDREAAVVRQVFRLFLKGDGTKGPMGVMDITSWLNSYGLKNRNGHPFYTSAVHKILTRETYAGVHHYNRVDSRSRRARPRGEWVAIPVPKIVSPKDFKRVQQRLHDRRPGVTPPRVTNSEVLLTGIARCESCGSPLMVRTGKGGRYRYYACSGHRLQGKTACPTPIAIPEAQLDSLVVSALADQLLTPGRLQELLKAAQRHRRASSAGALQQRSGLRKELKAIEAQIDRLFSAVAEGTIGDTALLRAKLDGLHARREGCLQLLSVTDAEVPALRQTLSKQQAITMAANLKKRLLDAPQALKRRYVRGLVSNIIVDREKAVISGPPAAIAAAITRGSFSDEVRSSIREWRTRQDSNL
jgi:site-specific DNA recombinase